MKDLIRIKLDILTDLTNWLIILYCLNIYSKALYEIKWKLQHWLGYFQRNDVQMMKDDVKKQDNFEILTFLLFMNMFLDIVYFWII